MLEKTYKGYALFINDDLDSVESFRKEAFAVAAYVAGNADETEVNTEEWNNFVKDGYSIRPVEVTVKELPKRKLNITN
jgi:hypothetical protein